MGVSLDLYRARIGNYVHQPHGTAADCWFSEAEDLAKLAHLASQTAGSEQMHQGVLSISPKLSWFLLLMIVLSAQCQACLLVIGAVETNPGPPTAAPEDVLARLSAGAPSSEIRDCIRLYDQKRDYSTNKKKFNAVQVGTLVGTMAYLGIPGQDVYTKPTIVHNLICRIQNLFPETCPICMESYCIERDELGLLPCSICGQACHAPCLLGLFGITEEEKSSFGPEEAKSKMNPFNLPGIFYICKVCEENHIPSEEAGKRKKGPTQLVTTEAVTTEETADTRQPVAPEEAQSHDLLDQNDPPNQIPHPNNGANPRQKNAGHTRTDQNNGNINPSQICPFYFRGTCRHGISGRGCSKLHPSPCRKLLTHGTKGPRGCNRGAQCEKFHPKMCLSSLKNAECLRESCKLRHVKGTRRVPPRRSDVSNGPERPHRPDRQPQSTMREDRSSSTHNPQMDFLAAIAALKTELLEAVDLKLRAVQSGAAGQTPMAMMSPPQHYCQQIYPWAQRGMGLPCKAPMQSTLAN